MAAKQLSVKAQMTRSSLVVAAAIILREEGPQAVTYRKCGQKSRGGVVGGGLLLRFDRRGA